MRLHRVPEASSPKPNPKPTFEHDGNALPSGIERVCAASDQEAPVTIPLTVRPYQVTAIPGRGLGLTACSIIDPHTKIDDCFTWELPGRDIKHVTETVLNGNYFDHPLNSRRGLVAIGHISLINHDPEPNCEWRMLQVHDRWMVEAWSLRRVSKGEELTFDYGYDPIAK